MEDDETADDLIDLDEEDTITMVSAIAALPSKVDGVIFRTTHTQYYVFYERLFKPI